MKSGDFYDWREWRRFRVVELANLGWHRQDIAIALGVSEAAISKWLQRVDQEGLEALFSHPHGGHSKLTVHQKSLIPDILWHGAEAYGFQGDFWTCARIVKVLQWEFGVTYHKDHLGRLLRNMGWSPQIPITRAIQRDEDAIEFWRTNTWPKLLTQCHHEGRTPVFIDESGFYLLPAVVRTYGPKGKTPVLFHWSGRDHLSVMGGLTANQKIYTLIRHKSLNGLHSILFLKHLLRLIEGPLLLIWDRSPIHRRAKVKKHIEALGTKRVEVEELPTYAPDLNPVEWLWKHLKNVELRNRTCVDLEELHMEFHIAIGHIRKKPKLMKSFFEGAKLYI